MGSENNNVGFSFKDRLPASPFKRARKSKERELQQIAEQEEQQTMFADFQESFREDLLTDGQAILEKVLRGTLAVDKVEGSPELAEFTKNYGSLASNKLLAHIKRNPMPLPPFQLSGRVEANSDSAFAYIRDKQGRECPIDLTELRQTNPTVGQLLNDLYCYTNQYHDEIALKETTAAIRNNADIQQLVQLQYARFLAKQMCSTWMNDNFSQILLHFLTAPETEQRRKQLFQNNPVMQNLMVDMQIQKEHAAQKEQNALEFPAYEDEDDEASRQLKSVPTPKSQQPKENVADNFKQLLRGILDSAASLMFGIEIVALVLNKAGFNDPKSKTDTATGKKDNQSYKLSTSLVTMFKKVKNAIALPNVAANFGEKLVDPITPSLRSRLG